MIHFLFMYSSSYKCQRAASSHKIPHPLRIALIKYFARLSTHIENKLIKKTKKIIAVGRIRTCAGIAQWISSPSP